MTQAPVDTKAAAQSESAAHEAWGSADSAQLYGIDRWSQGYFSVNQDGRVVVHAQPENNHGIDLMALVDELRERDLEPPLLLRFTDILRHRIGHMAQVFHLAIEENQYKGRYQCVYPIKVNQQRHVVEEVMQFGREHGFGVEAGSKPELLAAMAMVDDAEMPIICNGFKDAQFIEAVILAKKLGRNVIPVVEKFSELKLIVKYAKEHKVEPTIGVRVKLSSRGAGRWEHSGGARSKFGLFVSEVIDAVDYLREQGMLDCLKLLHFHVGSQIHDIRKLKGAITELTRVYAELHKLGTNLTYLDIGGGLGIDYDGNKSATEGSTNYTLQEYANDVIYHVMAVCDDAEVPHPTIISESGRAMVAYHSVLVFNVLGWSGFERFDVPDKMTDVELDELPNPVRALAEAWMGVNASNFVEYYHDAQVAWEETMNLFKLGYCTLPQRGLAERLFFAICSKVLKLSRGKRRVPEDLEGLNALLSDTYFCNCSIFQSLPDSWAIDQLFPIMPIHRLNEKPTCNGVLADITCDSDGKIDRFIDRDGVKQVLELHPYTGDDYFIGAFLVGAYQETLGDLHNLFGDTNAVHVHLDDDGSVVVDEVVEGDTVSEVLGYVQFEPDQLRRSFRQTVEKAVRDRRLTLEESRLLRRFYENGLSGYTYLT